MRIFVKPPEDGARITNVAQEALEALRSAGIASARIGGYINESGVVLVDPPDARKAVQVLTNAGLRAVSD
jgi:hypothetical protein